MGPGQSLMRDILWTSDHNEIDSFQFRVFGNLSTQKTAPVAEKIVPIQTYNVKATERQSTPIYDSR
jgi:hypothetical protein